ncbi:hypothetical protein GTP58_24545 [Duganella sp. CY15W]|uniref:hypothetical protein n=1 Tax=Duganella sp. CY15W TaxID=2692172 RepID=UPI00136A222E|nr:hypothetical protein [Duganella sp. CY15W]MYM31507.1 hypothetical protein [Duganella sp. CY15W]
MSYYLARKNFERSNNWLTVFFTIQNAEQLVSLAALARGTPPTRPLTKSESSEGCQQGLACEEEHGIP